MDDRTLPPATDFVLPANRKGVFALVKLWPGLKNAETEVAARVKRAAKKLGLTCIDITPDGHRTDASGLKVTQADVDFVLHLHYETPKAYDIFSFVGLWNPLRFYHEYIEGQYRRFSNNLLSHDDFLSCASPGADDHVIRMIAHDAHHLPPAFTFFHSLAEPIMPPTLGDQKLFYAGMNWEKLGRKKSRHQDLLDLLDKTDSLRIYGPRVFLGTKVWDGYDSYVGEIPFDGVSMVREVAAAGIGLVLSSTAHKESILMSNRLFECAAAGVVIICDENAWAKVHFGDTLLYIDTATSVEDTHQQIREHLRWINRHPEAALAKAKASQDIFKAKYTLDKSLADMYRGLDQRQAALAQLTKPKATPPVTLFMLLPTYDGKLLRRHLESLQAQTYPNIRAILLMDNDVKTKFGARVEAALKAADVKLEVQLVDFFERDSLDQPLRRRKFGELVFEHLQQLTDGAFCCFVSERESLFSDHIQLLVRTLLENEAASVAYATTVIKTDHNGDLHFELETQLDIFSGSLKHPFGAGRFLFRKPADLERLRPVLPYLDAKALALLTALYKSRPGGKTTIVLDVGTAKRAEDEAKNIDFENEIMCDFLPAELIEKFALHRLGVSNQATAKQFDVTAIQNMTRVQRLTIVRDLFLAIPMPRWLRSGVLAAYRRLLRRYS